MRVRPVALCLFAASIMLSPAWARANTAPANPSALVVDLGAQVKSVLGDATLTPVERQQRFRVLLDQDFDFPRIARFVLGRYWQGSSDAFRQEFGGVFEEYVVQSLSAGFNRYDGESIDITGTRAEGAYSTIVSTTVNHPDGAPSELVDWRVEETSAGYKIADVVVSGVSMAIAYREQFAAVIDRSGGQVAALIPELKQKVDGSPAAGGAGSKE